MKSIDLACKLLQDSAVSLEMAAEAVGNEVKAFVVREDNRIILTVRFIAFEIEMSMTMWDSTLNFNNQYIDMVGVIFARLTELALSGDELSILSIKRLLVAESN